MPDILLLLCNLIGCATAYPMTPDFLGIGSCPTVKLQPNFEIHKFQGLWWEILSVPNMYVASTSCTIQNSTLVGSSLKVYTTGLDIYENKVKQKSVLSPNMKHGSPIDSADLVVESPGVATAPYQVLATDYRNYSCIYSCMDEMGFKAEFAWVFGRTPHLGPKAVEKCNAVFRDFKIDPTILKKTKQGQICPYYHSLTEIIQSNEDFVDSIFDQKNAGDKSMEIVPTSAIHSSPINNLIQTRIDPITVVSNISTSTNEFTTDIPVTSLSPSTKMTTDNVTPTYTFPISTSTSQTMSTNAQDTTLVPFPEDTTTTKWVPFPEHTTTTWVPFPEETTSTTTTQVPFPDETTTSTTTTQVPFPDKTTTSTTTTQVPFPDVTTTSTITTRVPFPDVTTTSTTTTRVPFPDVTTTSTTTRGPFPDETTTSTTTTQVPFPDETTTSTTTTQVPFPDEITTSTTTTLVPFPDKTTSTLVPFTTDTYPITSPSQTTVVPSPTTDSSTESVIPTSTSITTEILPTTPTSQVIPTPITTLDPSKSSTTQIPDHTIPTPQPYVGSASGISMSWVFLLVIVIVHGKFFI